MDQTKGGMLLKAPESGSYYKVEIKWARKTVYFLDREEAIAYAEGRINKLLAHPTAGPTVNGRKSLDDIVVESLNITETFKLSRHILSVIWLKRLSILLHGAPLPNDGHYSATVTFFQEY